METFQEWLKDKQVNGVIKGLSGFSDFEKVILKEVYKSEIKNVKLEEENKKLRNNGNCKFGHGNICEYPEAVYTNCYVACDEWEIDESLQTTYGKLKTSSNQQADDMVGQNYEKKCRKKKN